MLLKSICFILLQTLIFCVLVGVNTEDPGDSFPTTRRTKSSSTSVQTTTERRNGKPAPNLDSHYEGNKTLGTTSSMKLKLVGRSGIGEEIQEECKQVENAKLINVYLTLFFMLIDVVDQRLNSVVIGTRRRRDERGGELNFIIVFFYLIHINNYFKELSCVDLVHHL